MARTTISIPDDLKAEMEKLGIGVNWSGIAARAFRAEVDRFNVRKERTAGAKMKAGLARLKGSQADYDAQGSERGYAEGVAWAQDSATFGELARLASESRRATSTRSTDALGAAGVFLRMISEREVHKPEVQKFWKELQTRDSNDRGSPEFWNGFTEGALAVFEAMKK
jgi:hypothetical protein